jgi:hypothetical protein
MTVLGALLVFLTPSAHAQLFVNFTSVADTSTAIPEGTDSDPPIDATPTDAATNGNQFRLTDAATGKWHFNLDTKATGMTKGTWKIVVTLADGSTHTAFITVM